MICDDTGVLLAVGVALIDVPRGTNVFVSLCGGTSTSGPRVFFVATSLAVP